MINLGCTPFGVTAYILYHILFRLSSTFSKVFYLFSKFFSNPCGIFLRRPLGQPIYYTTSLTFCQVLFRNFFIFSNSVIVHSLMSPKLCKMHREDSVHFDLGRFSKNNTDKTAASLVDDTLKSFGKLLS